MYKMTFYCLSLLYIAQTIANPIINTIKLDDNHQKISLSFTLQPEQWLYKDFLVLSTDNPDITITNVAADKDFTTQYDPAFKETKKIYTQQVTFLADVEKKPEALTQRTMLHISYMTNTQSWPEQKTYELDFTKQHEIASEKQSATTSDPSQKNEVVYKQSLLQFLKQLPVFVSGLLTTTQSLWLQFLLVFLLGMLLSLTPCIYPMIPITIGILQSHGSKSFFYNILVAFIYTCGMACTFAIFGLLASCVGPLCGKLLVHPLFVISLVCLLAYFAFSMLGLYDLYTPQFLKQGSSFKGGLFSAFLFGAASGSIASPCVSPGLALVLSIVAVLGNKILGFLLLFVFGIGLSMPLLIVGTCSSSLNILPQAGLWMIEIKRLIGLIMLLMCFYYLSYIMALHTVLFLLAVLLLVIGILYLYWSQQHISSFWKRISQAIGLLLVAACPMLFYLGYKQWHEAQIITCTLDTFWKTNWECALQESKEHNKKIFIDFWATFCPVCLAINKTVLTSPTIKQTLDHFVNIKVDGTYATNQPYALLKEKFNVTGFPVFIIYDPTTDKEVARFGSEIYDMDHQQLIELLMKHA